MTTTISRRRVLLVYLHLRPGTPDATCGLLREYIETFAARMEYTLDAVIVGVDDQSEPMTVRHLVQRIHDRGADTVLISGPVRAALAAVRQLSGVRVLTLAEVSGARAVKR